LLIIDLKQRIRKMFLLLKNKLFPLVISVLLYHAVKTTTLQTERIKIGVNK
jgi:hypothetical protein